MSIEKTYSPQDIETSWYETWEQNGYFAPAGTGAPYCIMLPPPNVTGSLHMGHAFQQTLMDVLIRYHRMLGDNTLWQGGTDHAGIATQMVVERQLERSGKSRRDLGRPAFEQAVWKWKETSGNTITRQSRRLGTSMDWSRERFTMNPDLSEAVQEVFIRLFEEDLIYRRKRLVNWDPVLHTAISDLEVISEEESGHLWHIRYPLEDGSGHVVVATTRPETMLGDAAVAVNPEDERYRSLKNKRVILPLTNRPIPVIEDDHVDPEFGTGCVKITPAHDFNDYEIGERHGLTKYNIFNRDAAIVGDSDGAGSPATHQQRGSQVSGVVDMASDIGIPEKYRGLDRFQARKLVLEDLRELGLLEKEEPHKLMIPRGDRSGQIIEPYLTDQWYVNIAPLAEPAIRAVEDGRIEFVPSNWAKTYFEWMRNIQDWCISRQLWWGHRIPVWYDKTDSNIYYVGRSEEEIRARHKLAEDVALVQDEDVLDTWFSSALWPFSTLGWPWETPELKTFYPGSVLVTGFDIIFFWVARMIMMGLRFMGDVPFKQVYIHGLVRDADGQKMSKSKGNILDPLDLIDGIDLESLVQKRTTGLMRPKDAGRIQKATHREFPEGIDAYGTDALRFTFAALASPGRNINFDVGRIGGYRNFCNKLWNAARYVLITLEQHPVGPGPEEYGLAERWIRTRLAQALDQVHAGIQDYRFDLAAQAIHEFTWDEYCDWYLELSKVTLTDRQASAAAKAGTARTLVDVLEVLLRMAHPFMPFITEELWQRVARVAGRTGPTIMLQPFPDPVDMERDEFSVEEMAFIKEVTLSVRRIRAERNIAPGKRVDLLHRGGGERDLRRLAVHAPYLQVLGRINSIAETPEEPADAAVAAVGDLSLYVPLELDYRAEIEALDRKISELEQEQDRVRHKLDNRQFVERAPSDVVEGQRRRLADTEKMLATYREQRARYETMLN